MVQVFACTSLLRGPLLWGGARLAAKGVILFARLIEHPLLPQLVPSTNTDKFIFCPDSGHTSDAQPITG